MCPEKGVHISQFSDKIRENLRQMFQITKPTFSLQQCKEKIETPANVPYLRKFSDRTQVKPRQMLHKPANSATKSGKISGKCSCSCAIVLLRTAITYLISEL